MISKALVDVLAERAKQNKKWGEQNHSPFVWVSILTEEVGEMAQAALHTEFGGPKGGADKLREEAIHAAAVAIAFVECIDRHRAAEAE